MKAKKSSLSALSRCLLMLTLVAALLMVGLATSLSNSVVAGPPYPLPVYGYIRDSAGHPLEGAYVTVTLRGVTLDDVSRSNGLYQVAFMPGWENGDEVHVIATWHGKQAESWGVVKYDDDHPILYVNVTYMFEIGEYGSGAIGLLLAGGFVAAVAVVLLTKRKPERKAG